MATTTRLMTVEDLERDGAPEGRWELINGELVEMAPASEDHGAYGAAIIVFVGSYVVGQKLGRIYNSETGFVVSGDSPMVRMPDVAFVHYDHLPADRDRSRLVRAAPDFAVEVISPSDRPGAVLAKVMMWLDAGVRLVWLVDPELRTVTVFAPEAPPRTHTIDQTLDGGDVLPGFTLPVRGIFSV